MSIRNHQYKCITQNFRVLKFTEMYFLKIFHLCEKNLKIEQKKKCI